MSLNIKVLLVISRNASERPSTLRFMCVELLIDGPLFYRVWSTGYQAG